jgi:hypothetical protein
MAETGQLHVAMFPWVAFGHIIPFVELAKLIAQKGHKVSFISTPRNIDRLPKNLPHNLLTLVKIPFTVPLPDNAEATIDLPFNVDDSSLKKAYDGLKDNLSSFMESQKPGWIIYDFAPYWLPEIAATLGIRRCFFNIVSARSICFLAPSTAAMLNAELDPRIEPEHFTVSPTWVPFRSPVCFRLHEAKTFCSKFFSVESLGVSDGFRLGSVISGCDVLATRSSMELESDWVNLLGELHREPVLPVGLLPPSVVESDSDNREWIRIEKWLNERKTQSVVYIAFGSEATPSHDELTELAHGLELSELPFIWALREQHYLKLPEGFEIRTSVQGLICKGWAPQVKILSHDSVGSFLTHCGWSSIIEGLLFGRAIIMLPIFLDQGLTAREFAEKKVGVEIPRNEEDGTFNRSSVAEILKMVMTEEKGKALMENAGKMKKVIGDKEVNNKYIDHFVTYLQNHM